MESIDKVSGTFGKRQSEHKTTVSSAVIRRLPRYHRCLGDLLRAGRLRISSSELAKIMDVTASQIRQDLNCFGGFGQQGYGYNVNYLFAKISEILRTTLICPPLGLMASNLSSIPRVTSSANSSARDAPMNSAPVLKLLHAVLFSVIPL